MFSGKSTGNDMEKEIETESFLASGVRACGWSEGKRIWKLVRYQAS